MKNKILSTFFVVILCAFKLSAQQKQVVFSYDAAGNQSERKLICINCPIPRTAALNSEEVIADITKEDLSITGRSVKAYPNPVSEVLNVSWKITEKDIFLKSIDVYTIGGVKVFGSVISAKSVNFELSFSKLPPAMYILRILYSDNKQEVFKIIKI